MHLRAPLILSLLYLPTVMAQAGDSEIRIGMEYALIENPVRVTRLAQALAPIGAPAVKHYAEHLEWGEMQKGPDAPIDFKRLDSFVRDFQAAGFTDLVVCLRSHSLWASRQYRKLGSPHPEPKPEHMDAYANWIAAVVERYDGDGKEDMSGLRLPVKIYEIGSEFSSYEPESPAEYLPMLERAHRAAHKAFPGVQIAHAAFLTTGVFPLNITPMNVEGFFAAGNKRILEHGLADLRKILDRPDLFDLANLHILGDPAEIESNMAWLHGEMKSRSYSKPVIISDTASSPFIAWGPATNASLPPNARGLLIPPATEADRPRLATYFTRLVDGDRDIVRWTQECTARDMVQKVVIAAEQKVMLINTAFIEDLVWLKLKIFRAGTGTSAWSGLINLDKNERRAGFYELQQVTAFLKSYDSIQRLMIQNPDFKGIFACPPGFDAALDHKIRVYEIWKKGRPQWIAWHDPLRVVLPGEAVPSKQARIPFGVPSVAIIPLRTGEALPTGSILPTQQGVAVLLLTPNPVFITPAD